MTSRSFNLSLKGTVMKAAVFSIALALSAGAAFAEGPIYGNEVFNFQSTLSRAEVRAQAVEARDKGLFAVGEGTIVVAEKSAPSTLTRAQVRAEATEAMRLGLLDPSEVTRVPTAEQAELIRLAGERAAQGEKLAQN
jgi:hypothetical protein